VRVPLSTRTPTFNGWLSLYVMRLASVPGVLATCALVLLSASSARAQNCVSGTTFGNTAANTTYTQHDPEENGQSLTATCTGFIYSIRVTSPWCRGPLLRHAPDLQRRGDNGHAADVAALRAHGDRPGPLIVGRSNH
jgi:hypothetical protein